MMVDKHLFTEILNIVNMTYTDHCQLIEVLKNWSFYVQRVSTLIWRYNVSTYQSFSYEIPEYKKIAT